MSFPVLPPLPEDPIEGVRIFRIYLHELGEYLTQHRSYALAGVAAIALSVLTVGSRWVGLDKALPVLADAVPLLIAIVGVIMSYKQPKKENYFRTTLVLVTAGCVGTLIMSEARIRSESAHRIEMGNVTNKLASVASQNSQILQTVLSQRPSPPTAEQQEIARQKNIYDLLRNEYVLGHNNISPGLLAGTEYPPVEWMNARLHELGEKRAFVNPTPLPTVSVAPEPDKAELVFSFLPELAEPFPMTHRIVTLKGSVITVVLVAKNVSRET